MRMLHAWGMTETSPMCTVANVPDGLDPEREWALRATQGRPVPVRRAAPRRRRRRRGAVGRRSTGEIEVRGPWIASAYYRDDDREPLRRRLAAHRRHRPRRPRRLGRDHRPLQGRHQVRRRVDLLGRARERADVAPGVREAAVIAIADERWGERPLACVVLAEGARPAPRQLREHLRERVPCGGCPTSSRSSTRSRRRASASSTRRCCAPHSRTGALEGRVRIDMAASGPGGPRPA